MVDKNDWRLTGQDRYLLNQKLYFRKWKASSEQWEHDHCVFCWEEFSDMSEALHEGYTTKDEYYWVCPKCFNDFKAMFQWDVEHP